MSWVIFPLRWLVMLGGNFLFLFIYIFWILQILLICVLILGGRVFIQPLAVDPGKVCSETFNPIFGSA